jgi:hypothetical protein
MENINIRRSTSNNDSKGLKTLLNHIFNPEKVGDLAETFFYHLPGMKPDYWFLAEDTLTSQLISSFTLIPWVWEYKGVELKIAEMGLVGTDENYRGKGLMKLLNKEFDKTIEEEKFDLAVIQGIPGFYHRFGYYYALAMENHINLFLDSLPEIEGGEKSFNFRLANEYDIPFLLKEDSEFRKQYSISVKRDEPAWKYILTNGKSTDYGSDVWIMENSSIGKKYYFRIQLQGFGTGLILNETSENMEVSSLKSLLSFCRKLAIERSKPYIRINMHNESGIGKYAISLGTTESLSYAWQIKIHNKLNFLKKIKPILEKRLTSSSLNNVTGNLRLDFYLEKIDILFENGKIKSISTGNQDIVKNTFCISADLFPALCLGHRSWKELQHVRPDIFPEPLYVNPVADADNISGQLIDILFPKSKSWVYLQY